MEEFSIILIKNRQRLNLSQEEVAIKLGTNQSTYQEWEKGRSPKLEYLPKLKALFGLSSMDDFFGESSNSTPPRNSAFVIDFERTLYKTCFHSF